MEEYRRKNYFPGRKYDCTMRGWGEIVEYRGYSAGMYI